MKKSLILWGEVSLGVRGNRSRAGVTWRDGGQPVGVELGGKSATAF